MENVDVRYLCSTIGALTGVPVRVYENGEQVFYYSLADLPKDPITPYLREILAMEAHVGYFITPRFHYYGIIHSPDVKIVLGPSRQLAAGKKDLLELAFECDVPADDRERFVRAMESIVPMPLDSILQTLCAVNYVLNGEKLSLEDVTICDAEQRRLDAELEGERADRRFHGDLPEIASGQAVHNTFDVEQTISEIVRKGDTAALTEWVANAPAVRGGTLAADGLRQQKNLFIVSATLVSRAAIRGGMDVNDALSLSDAYIQKCELLSHVERITNLQYHMLLDYTERVERLRLGRSPSKLVTDIGNYVQHHLSEPVNIEALAKAMYMSRTYLAAKFKKETGISLTEFVLKEKTEEAKRLLRYTDKSLSAIGAYLGFSSQSHFANTFRKYTGESPKEYRLRHRG